MYMEVIILLATCATSLFFMACQRPLKFPDRDQYFTFLFETPRRPIITNQVHDVSGVFASKTPLPSFKNHFPFFSAFVLKCTVTQIHVCNCKSCFKIGLEKPGCTELTFNNYCKPHSLTPHQWCIAVVDKWKHSCLGSKGIFQRGREIFQERRKLLRCPHTFALDI